MPKLRFDQYISLFLLLITCFTQTGMDIRDRLYQNRKVEVFKPLPKITKEVVVPVFTGDMLVKDTLASLSATAIYVMDRETGSVLYEKNAQESRYPASTAKMMTALVAREIYPLEKVLKVDKEAFTTGTIVGFQVGEELMVQDLLSGLLISSGNDAAFVLANNHVFGYDGFVTAMNQKAAQLHLTNTKFGNPSGLDKEGQSASARDLAILAKELMKDAFLREVVGTREKMITDDSGQNTHPLYNRNQLLGVEEGVVGVKTGTTGLAGESLVTEVDRNGHKVIIVLLGSNDRYAETRQLIHWVFSSHDWIVLNSDAR